MLTSKMKLSLCPSLVWGFNVDRYKLSIYKQVVISTACSNTWCVILSPGQWVRTDWILQIFKTILFPLVWDIFALSNACVTSFSLLVVPYIMEVTYTMVSMSTVLFGTAEPMTGMSGRFWTVRFLYSFASSCIPVCW